MPDWAEAPIDNIRNSNAKMVERILMQQSIKVNCLLTDRQKGEHKLTIIKVFRDDSGRLQS